MAKQILQPISVLIDSFLKHIKPQPDRFEVADPKTPGLRVRVNPTGKINFVWYYRDNGKNKVLTMGQYGGLDGQLTLKKAREALENAKKRHEAGELSTNAGIPQTVSEVAEVFYRDRILPHRRRPDAVRQILDHDILPTIGNRKLSTLTTVTVSNCVQVVVKRGALSHAGKVTALLKQLFKFAEGRGYIDRSPAYALDKKDLGVVEKVRERWLKAEEIKPVWDAIEAAPRMSLPVRNALKVLMLTGARTGELMHAEWKHINFETSEWFIPKENTKTQSEWIVPLTPAVIDLLKDLEEIHEKYVFAGIDGQLNDKALGRAMRRLFEMDLLQIDRCTPHDFRRTVRTHLETLNIEPHICEKVLNHSLGRINAVYNKNNYLSQRREALEKWTDFVDLLVNERENVVILSGMGGR